MSEFVYNVLRSHELAIYNVNVSIPVFLLWRSPHWRFGLFVVFSIFLFFFRFWHLIRGSVQMRAYFKTNHSVALVNRADEPLCATLNSLIFVCVGMCEHWTINCIIDSWIHRWPKFISSSIVDTKLNQRTILSIISDLIWRKIVSPATNDGNGVLSKKPDLISFNIVGEWWKWLPCRVYLTNTWTGLSTVL